MIENHDHGERPDDSPDLVTDPRPGVAEEPPCPMTHVSLNERVLAQVTHDLRVPLQAITTSVRVLRKGDVCRDGAKLESGLAIIERCASRMSCLVDELVDTERLRTGTLVLCRSLIRLDELIAEACEMLQPFAEKRNIHMHVAVGNPPAPLSCDEERVLRVFTNLIANAIKFTQEGGDVFVSTGCSAHEVFVEVRDNGPGIPEHERANVFAPFHIGQGKARSGLGLGLYIASSIIAAHGGRITLDGKPGAGACFTVILPIQGARRATEVGHESDLA